jgi:hypothetical protein
MVEFQEHLWNDLEDTGKVKWLHLQTKTNSKLRGF